MRRVFHDEFGVSPIEYWQTQRLLLAKQLLTDSRLSVASVALASGFQSLRRFNVALKKRYRLTPTELRKRQKRQAAENSSEFSFRLSYRPPFDWEHLLGFLSRRAIPQVETVTDGAYFRTVRLSRQNSEFTGFLEVRHEPDQRMISVRLSDTLVPVCAIVLERLKRLFDLQADPAAIGLVLGPLAKGRPGLRVPGSFDGFEMAMRAILGQQVSVAGARTMAGRLAARFGTRIDVPVPSLGISSLSPSESPGPRSARWVNWESRADAPRPLSSSPKRSAAAICCWSRATEWRERCGNFAKFPGLVNGPPSTSRCALFHGLTPFRIRTWDFVRRLEKTTRGESSR